jgi:regulator of protease activity HflC (stomatin/prohibitin superfamily)
MSLAPLVLLVTVAVLLLATVRIVKEGERLVVFRLGRYHRVLGPGLHMIAVGVDTPHRVNLNAVVPDWPTLSEQDLAAQLEHLARTGQLGAHT